VRPKAFKGNSICESDSSHNCELQPQVYSAGRKRRAQWKGEEEWQKGSTSNRPAKIRLRTLSLQVLAARERRGHFIENVIEKLHR
jgi:hypothetical protein